MSRPLATPAGGVEPARPAANEQPAPLAEIKARQSRFRGAADDCIRYCRRLQAAWVYRAMVVKRFGGVERALAEFCSRIEATSEANG